MTRSPRPPAEIEGIAAGTGTLPPLKQDPVLKIKGHGKRDTLQLISQSKNYKKYHSGTITIRNLLHFLFNKTGKVQDYKSLLTG